MFQQRHRTGYGKTLLIAQMEDEHLLNMIGSVVSWAERATEQFFTIMAQAQDATRMLPNGAAIAMAHRRMYSLPDPLKLDDVADQYGTAMNQLAGRLEPYLLEAWTRQLSEADQTVLDDLRSRWRAAVGRSSAMPNPEHRLVLAQSASDDDGIPF